METGLLRQFVSTGPAELLLASIWQGLLLTALAWVSLKLAPGLRASTRFALWFIAFLLVALLPCFAIGTSGLGAHSLPVNMPQADLSVHLNTAWAFVLEGLWAAASLFALARLAAGALQMRAVLRMATPVALDDLDEEIQTILSRAGSRQVEVRLSDAVDAPSVVGFLHPAVIVPRSLWGELAPGERKQIILHEVAHLDRADDWTNLFQKLFRALCPLNPALYWAERQLCLEREQACDDAVLDAAGNARAYATCLTKLAETRMVRRAAALAPGMWQRHSELAGRVENILHRRRTPGPVFARGLVAASLLASLSGVLLLQRCPELITFSVPAAPVSSRPLPEATQLAKARPAAPFALTQARYQGASFHPTPKPRAAHKVYTAHVRFVELRSTRDDSGEGFTLILFTMEAPRASHQITTDNWIVFQI